MAQPKKTLYEILGVPTDASDADIAAAHERRRTELERAATPDTNEQAVLRQAYDVLKDPRRRATYDASLAAAREKTAALEQAPDLQVEEEPRKLPWIPIAIGVAVVLAILFFAMRPGRTPTPASQAQPATAPEPAATPEPAKATAAPLRTRTGAEIITVAVASGGPLLSYSMAGQAKPVGMAISTETGTMVTTCHGIPAGEKLVVRIGNESHPADLLITDEALDLCKLQIASFAAPPVTLAPDEPKAGERIFAIGVNAKGETAATEGTVKQILATTEGRLIELSMPIGPFSSGGGVFDAYGRLIGIATVQHRSGLSIALPASSLSAMRSRGATK